MKRIIHMNGLKRLRNKLIMLIMLLLRDPPQPSQITIIESMLGLTHKTTNLTNLNGKPKQLKLLKVDTMLPPKDHKELDSYKDQPQLFQTTTIELTPGLTLKIINLTNPNGKPRLLKLLKVDTMSPPKEDKVYVSFKPQLFQITTTELMPGLTHKTTNPTNLSGRPRLPKSPKVATTSPHKLENTFILLNFQTSLLTTTE